VFAFFDRAEIDRHKTGLGVLAFVRLDAIRDAGDVWLTCPM